MRKSTSGVYLIKNSVNGNVYIGSSVNCEQRKNCHLSDLRRGKHCNPHLQRAFNKYGENSFKIFTLEECDPIERTAKEQEWIDHFSTSSLRGVYNVNLKTWIIRGKAHSDETRQKISAAAKHRKPISEETRRRLSESHKGIIPSAQTIELRRQKAIGRKMPPEGIEKSRIKRTGLKRTPEQIERVASKLRGRKMSPEAIENRVKHLRGKKRPQYIIDILKSKTGLNNSHAKIIMDVNTGVFYGGVTEVANLYGIKRHVMAGYLANPARSKTPQLSIV